MSKAKCPGQDTRYWKPGDIFNLKCGRCGKSIEFFKDDVSRRCPECGTRVQNPKITIGCALWCEHAAECLGYDLKTAVNEFHDETEGKSLIKIIFEEIAARYGRGSNQYHAAEIILAKAESMLKGKTSDAKIVLPAALMLAVETGRSDAVPENSGTARRTDKSFPSARDILTAAGIDNNVIKEICELIAMVFNGVIIDSPEFAIVRECYDSLNSGSIN